MSKRIYVALGWALFACAATAAQEQRTLFLHSDPMYAAIVVNGEPLEALTPAIVTLPVASDAYEVELVRRGYLPHRTTIRFGAQESAAAHEAELVPDRSLLYIDGAGRLATPGTLLDGTEGAIRIDRALLSVEAAEGVVTVSRVYPREGVRRLLGWAVPVFALFTAAATWEDLADTRGNITFSVGTLAAATATVGSATAWAALSLDRARTFDPDVETVSRDATARAAEELAILADRDFRVGLFDSARTRYEELIDRHPDSGAVPAALIRLADIHRLQRRDETARALYRSVVRDFAAPVAYNSALLSLSELSLAQGRADAALEHIDATVVGVGDVPLEQILLQRAAVLQRVVIDRPDEPALRERLVETFTALAELVPEGPEREGYRAAIDALAPAETAR